MGSVHSSASALRRSSETIRTTSASLISVTRLSPPAVEEVLRQPLLLLDQGVDPLLHSTAADELVDDDVPLLPDPEGPVGRLVLDGRVPPAVEVDHLGGRRQVEAGAAGAERQHEEGDRLVGLEALDERHALLHRGLAVEHEAGPPEDPAEVPRQGLGHLAELGEHQHLLLAQRELLAQLGQAGELAALLGREAPVAEPLRGMVADLLEPQQGGEDRAAPLDAVHRAEPPLELLHGLLVEGRLLPGERAVRAHLGLLGQVGDDPAVGLEPSQDVGPDQRPERPVVAVPAGRQLSGDPREGPGAAEQAGVQEVEQRPEIREAVLDRRARQRDAGPAPELLDRPRLLGGRDS